MRYSGLYRATYRTHKQRAWGHVYNNFIELFGLIKIIMDLHTLLIGGLLGVPSAVGALRSVVVKFDDCRYLPPDNPHQLNEIFDQFCEKVSAIDNPHEQAFFTMSFIPYIQPFQDGNKRTSRIAMNIPLVKNELAPFSFSDMSKRDYMFGLLAFYERGRHEFLARTFSQAYEISAERYSELIQHINDGGLLNSVTMNKEKAEEIDKPKQKGRSRNRDREM